MFVYVYGMPPQIVIILNINDNVMPKKTDLILQQLGFPSTNNLMFDCYVSATLKKQQPTIAHGGTFSICDNFVNSICFFFVTLNITLKNEGYMILWICIRNILICVRWKSKFKLASLID